MNIEVNNYKDLIKYLTQNSCGDEFIKFSYRIIKTKKEIIGVKVPFLREIAKEIYNVPHDWLYKNFDNKIYEVIMVQGLVIAQEEKSVAKKMFSQFIKQVDNWAVVDTIVGSIKFAQKLGIEGFEYFKAFALSKNEFESRFGIIGLMKFYLEKEYIFETLTVVGDVKCEKYYVEMAIAWLISEIMIKNTQNAIEIMQKIIKNTQLNKFIINKAIQKACESYRIEQKIKYKLKEMKIK